MVSSIANMFTCILSCRINCRVTMATVKQEVSYICAVEVWITQIPSYICFIFFFIDKQQKLNNLIIWFIYIFSRMGSVLSFSPSDVAVALLKNKSNWCFSYMLIIYKSRDYTYTNHLIQIMRCRLEIIVKTLKQIFVCPWCILCFCICWTLDSRDGNIQLVDHSA